MSRWRYAVGLTALLAMTGCSKADPITLSIPTTTPEGAAQAAALVGTWDDTWRNTFTDESRFNMCLRYFTDEDEVVATLEGALGEQLRPEARDVLGELMTASCWGE